MRKNLFLLLLPVACTLLLAACGCSHQWLDATCTAPKTCSACGETQGEAIGHTWAEADCHSPRTCSGCGETEGEPLTHQWQDADCEAPETCSLCGETRGKALGHQAGCQQPGTVDFVTATGDYSVSCDVCGKELEAGNGAITTFHDGTEFLCTVVDFYSRLYDIGNSVDINMFLNPDQEGIWVNELYSDLPDCYLVSRNLFLRGDTLIRDMDDDQQFTGVKTYLGISTHILITLTDVDMTFLHMFPVMQSCDPLMTESLARELLNELLTNGTAEANGITYTFEVDDDLECLVLLSEVSGQ